MLISSFIVLLIVYSLIILFGILNSVNFFLILLYLFLSTAGVVILYLILIMILLTLLGKKYEKNQLLYFDKSWKLMVSISKFCVFYLGIKICYDKKMVLELQNLDKPIVFYSNHQSFVDILVYYIIFEKIKHSTLFKSEINRVPFICHQAYALGGVTINRSNDREAATAIVKIIRKVKEGSNFLIFPEGTRSRGNALHEYKAGSFKIIQKTDSYLAVLVIDGAYKKRTAWPLVYTKIKVNVPHIYSSSELSSLTTHEIASKVMDDANNELKAMRIK